MQALIEKLEELKKQNLGEVMPADWAIEECIEIIKKHSEWTSFLGSDKPKHDRSCLFLLKNEDSENPLLTDVGLVREYKSGYVVLSLRKAETMINTNYILAWKPFEYPCNDFVNELIKKNEFREVQSE